MNVRHFALVLLILISPGLAFSYYVQGDEVTYENGLIRLSVAPYTSSAPVGWQEQTLSLVEKQNYFYEGLKIGVLFPSQPSINLLRKEKAKKQKVKDDLPKQWDTDYYD